MKYISKHFGRPKSLPNLNVNSNLNFLIWQPYNCIVIHILKNNTDFIWSDQKLHPVWIISFTYYSRFVWRVWNPTSPKPLPSEIIYRRAWIAFFILWDWPTVILLNILFHSQHHSKDDKKNPQGKVKYVNDMVRKFSIKLRICKIWFKVKLTFGRSNMIAFVIHTVKP